MPLILAVEPNNSQAQQLTSLVRQYLQAELVTASSAKAALQALGDRIPDLILTPALLAPKDEAALTERLRELGNAAAHVQTLAVPILASGRSRPTIGGLLGRKREKADAGEPVGCHPSVFAEQIQIYLERAAHQRDASSDADAGAAVSTPPHEAPAAEDEPLGDDDTLDVIFDIPLDPPHSPAAGPSGGGTVSAPAASADVRTPPPPKIDEQGSAVESHGRTKAADTPPGAGHGAPGPPPARPAQTRSAEMELGLLGAPAGSPPLWRIAEEVEDFYRGTASFAPTGDSPVETSAVEPAVAAAPVETPPEPAADAPILEDAAAGSREATEEAILEVDLDDVLSVAARAASVPHHTHAAGSAGSERTPAASPSTSGAHAGKASQKGSRKKRSAPPADDWTYFDASQSPFKALVRRLDEIAGHAPSAD